MNQLALNEWRRKGAELADIARQLPWHRGDWYLAAESIIDPDRAMERDKRAEQIVKRGDMPGHGIDWKLIRKNAEVCRRFPEKLRREKLTFAHHESVADLPHAKAEHWLTLCEKHGLSAADLRQQIRQKLRPRSIKPEVLYVLPAHAAQMSRWLRAQMAGMNGERARRVIADLGPLLETVDELKRK